MAIDTERTPIPEVTLAVPGVLCIAPIASGGNLVYTGAAAGWMAPRGLLRWERELSFAARGDLTAELARALRATLPYEQIPPKKLPLAFRAVEASPFLALSTEVVDDVRKRGIRVHTVGVDRVSAGFYYFSEGGAAEPVRVQGNLIEMLSGVLKPSSTNADIAALQEGLLDRLLSHFSGGVVSELAVELADALPRLSKDGSGLEGTHLEVFEVQARALGSRSSRWEAAARQLVEALEAATNRGEVTAKVPLFGDARQQAMRPLKVMIGDETTTLPSRTRWSVSGAPREDRGGAVETKTAAATAPAVQAPPAAAAAATARTAAVPATSPVASSATQSPASPPAKQPAPSPRPGAAVPRPRGAGAPVSPRAAAVTQAAETPKAPTTPAEAAVEATPPKVEPVAAPAVAEVTSPSVVEAPRAPVAGEPARVEAAALPREPETSATKEPKPAASDRARGEKRAGEAIVPKVSSRPPLPRTAPGPRFLLIALLVAAAAYLLWRGWFAGGGPHG
jgi:hypothetical protein